MLRDFPPPRSASWERLARQWLANPSPGPEPRLAATVMLLRDGAGGPEVFVLRRVATMEFAPLMHVFPGGGADPHDADYPLDAATLGALADAMGWPPEQARPVVAAAVREVAEECGVRLEPTALRVRAHWITPHFERRRYDTWIFAARLPPGQEAAGSTTEADLAHWARPQQLLDDEARGSVLLLPPTLVSLEQLAGYATVEEFIADQPPVLAILPELVDTGEAVVVRSELP